MPYRDLIQLVGLGFMACPDSFLSSCAEKHSDAKSGREVDPDIFVPDPRLP